MPRRHEVAGLGKEQEEQPVHHDQRLIEQLRVGVAPRHGGAERRDQLQHGIVNSGSEGTSHGGAMPLGMIEHALEHRPIAASGERAGAEQRAQDTKTSLDLQRHLHLELNPAPRVGPLDVEGANGAAVDADRPADLMRQTASHGLAPQAAQGNHPWRRNQRSHRACRGGEECTDSLTARLDHGDVEPERAEQRLGNRIEDRACGGGRPKPRPDAGMPRPEMAMRLVGGERHDRGVGALPQLVERVV